MDMNYEHFFNIVSEGTCDSTHTFEIEPAYILRALSEFASNFAPGQNGYDQLNIMFFSIENCTLYAISDYCYNYKILYL